MDNCGLECEVNWGHGWVSEEVACLMPFGSVVCSFLCSPSVSHRLNHTWVELQIVLCSAHPLIHQLHWDRFSHETTTVALNWTSRLTERVSSGTGISWHKTVLIYKGHLLLAWNNLGKGEGLAHGKLLLIRKQPLSPHIFRIICCWLYKVIFERHKYGWERQLSS